MEYLRTVSEVNDYNSYKLQINSTRYEYDRYSVDILLLSSNKQVKQVYRHALTYSGPKFLMTSNLIELSITLHRHPIPRFNRFGINIKTLQSQVFVRIKIVSSRKIKSREMLYEKSVDANDRRAVNSVVLGKMYDIIVSNTRQVSDPLKTMIVCFLYNIAMFGYVRVVRRIIEFCFISLLD